MIQNSQKTEIVKEFNFLIKFDFSTAISNWFKTQTSVFLFWSKIMASELSLKLAVKPFLTQKLDLDQKWQQFSY